MTANKTKLSDVDKGRSGGPGSGYTDAIARVYRLANGRLELYTRAAHGSDQGSYTECHGKIERTYRASSIDDLLRVGISETRQDGELTERYSEATIAALCAAIREACHEAEDHEATGGAS